MQDYPFREISIVFESIWPLFKTVGQNSPD